MDPRFFQELSEVEALERLASVSVGRIVFTHRALPAVRPVNHIVANGHIIIRTDPDTVLGRKVMPSGTVVAFETDELDMAEHLGWAVTVTGTARAVDDPWEATRFKDLLRPWLVGDMDQVIRIHPQIITGFTLVPSSTADGSAQR
ncbi:pyridoxamine 5'-phosphate oxidase family protein [Nonomuraea basaltis]|uniref:pyridoxamine 5'-phosphate oxidase family protein n=1 Tax=Nonomuraea basaltis TaxID=2495887 RepID=UPI00110C58CB|nr:pyridoxamine 5'-phosphate oxidase family protein [Nonomuraea basaltis]TMR96836.1 pyridoxamine 5'-phosphate oxidase family protein [Nonomuraea basaltis]